METNEQSADSSPLRPQGDSRCAVHSQKTVSFVCYDCNDLICGKCVTSLHSGHIMEELSDAMPSIKSKLELSITSMESEQLPNVQRSIDLTEEKLIDNKTRIKEVVCQMKSQGNKCKDEIDDMIDEYVSVCDKLGKENTDLLMRYKTEHQARLRDLTEQIKNRHQIMQTGCSITMFDALYKRPSYETAKWPSLHTARFSPCKVVTDLLKQALGQLDTSFDIQQSSTNHCRPNLHQERQVSNDIHERLTHKPSPPADRKNTLESTDWVVLHQDPSNDNTSSTRPKSQRSGVLRSGHHPPRPASERVRGKSSGPPNRPHQRPQPRTVIFKRRNSLEAPSSIHRFLSARPSTSSDIRPMITVRSSTQRPETHVSVSVSRRHDRRSMSLPSEQSPEPPSGNPPSPSLLQAILSSSRDLKPNGSFSQEPKEQCIEVSSQDIEPQINHVSSHSDEIQITKVQSLFPDQPIPASDHEHESAKVTPPKPERTRKALSKRPVHQPVILSQFPSPSAITSICLTSEGHAWTCDEESRVLTLVGNAGDVIKTVTCKANVNDISMSPKTQHLWYCTWKCRVVELDPDTDTRMRRFTTESWPRCICVTDREQILVGAENKITLYNTDGQVVMATDTEASGVIRPTRLTQCPLTGNIAFLEKTAAHSDGQNNGHVVVLDNALSVKFRYTGECETLKTEESAFFDPFDVKYDDKGYLLIGDFTSNTLDLITGEGNHIRTILTDTGSSQAIGIHTDDVMWAAFENDNGVSHVKILKY